MREELIQQVNSIRKNFGEEFYHMGIETLVTWYQKGLDHNSSVPTRMDFCTDFFKNILINSVLLQIV